MTDAEPLRQVRAELEVLRAQHRNSSTINTATGECQHRARHDYDMGLTDAIRILDQHLNRQDQS